MVKAKIYVKSESGFRLEVKGHAGAGKPGTDIVCAAVSFLADCLVQQMKRLEKDGMTRHTMARMEPGYAEIEVWAADHCWYPVALLYHLTLNSFQRLALAYPINVQLERVVMEEK